MSIATPAPTHHFAALRPERAPHVRSIDTLRAAAAVFFRFPSPRLLAAQWTAFALLRLAVGDFTLWDLAVVGGVALYWPFQEWTAHRYVLHMRPRTVLGVRVDPAPSRVHRAHHRQPWNLDHVFLPGRFILGMIPIHIAAWLVFAPTLALALTGMVAFGGAALFYEWIHYLTHTFYKPRSAWYRRVWRGHRLHHFKSEHHWLGFTAPGIDLLLGTSPDPKDVETSPTCATLGIDEDA